MGVRIQWRSAAQPGSPSRNSARPPPPRSHHGSRSARPPLQGGHNKAAVTRLHTLSTAMGDRDPALGHHCCDPTQPGQSCSSKQLLSCSGKRNTHRVWLQHITAGTGPKERDTACQALGSSPLLLLFPETCFNGSLNYFSVQSRQAGVQFTELKYCSEHLLISASSHEWYLKQVLSKRCPQLPNVNIHPKGKFRNVKHPSLHIFYLPSPKWTV